MLKIWGVDEKVVGPIYEYMNHKTIAERQTSQYKYRNIHHPPVLSCGFFHDQLFNNLTINKFVMLPSRCITCWCLPYLEVAIMDLSDPDNEVNNISQSSLILKVINYCLHNSTFFLVRHNQFPSANRCKYFYICAVRTCINYQGFQSL